MWRLLAAVTGSVLAATVSLSAVADAAAQAVAPVDQPATVRVRPRDDRARGLLEYGRTRSATFRRLCDTLERGELIVLIDTSPFLRRKVPAQTTFLTDSASVRVVRITVALPGEDDVLGAWLGHELQHAVEIMSAHDVLNAGAMAAFYRAHGQEKPTGFCTPEAQRVRIEIADELASPGRARR